MASPAPRKLVKGELLFKEGEASKSMYYVQNGMIRLFKQKGSSSIELGMIRKGEVIGEMGFLDGGPRSASAEALHDTVLVEITNTQLAEQLKVLPPWLLVLLKTVVNRLRTANNKIRQLETSSTALSYSSDGVSTQYVFLNIYDILKVLTACLVTAARNGQTVNGTIKCSLSKITRYANQIMGVHENKISELLDILEQVGLAKIDKAVLDKIEVYFTDVDQIESLVNYVNDENLKEHSKKQKFSMKAVVILGLVSKHLGQFPPNQDGISEINLATIINAEKQANGGKEPFRMDEFIELTKEKIASEPAFRDSNNIIVKMNAAQVAKLFKIQKFLKQIEIINEKKREQAARGAAKMPR